MLGYDIQNENHQYIKANSTEFMGACRGVDGPEVLDPRDWYRIEMQYSMSSCVGHGLTGPIEVSYRNKMGQIQQFSRMDAYLASQKYSDIIQPGCQYFGRDGGALIAGARKASVERGVCLESTFPYPPTAAYSTHVANGADAQAAQFKIGSSSLITPDSDSFDQCLAYLKAGLGGLLVGAPWPFQIGPNHTVTNFRSYGSSGHAWCIIGYLKDLLVAANSHSTAFEDKGFFYLNRQGCNEMNSNRGTTIVGLSDLTVPRPRKVDWTKESMFS